VSGGGRGAGAPGAAPYDRTRLAALLEARGIDVLLASSRHNIRYLTGGYCYPLFQWDAHTRGTQYLPFLVVPREAPEAPVFVGRPGEREVLEDAGVAVDACHESAAIGTRPAAAKLVEVLRGADRDGGTIGVELPSLPADAWDLLREGLPRATFVDAVPVLDALRAVKSADEIELMRRGADIGAEVLDAVLSTGREGETTLAVARRVEDAARARGMHHLYALVCAGPSLFRAPTKRFTWRRDGVLHVDTGATLGGYIAELCRTAVLGTPSPLADRMLAGCRGLEDAALPALRAGALAREVQAAGDEFLHGHELGRHGRFIAHGIGLVHHEDPVIDAKADGVLEPGMVVSLEMEFVHPDVGHVKIEDLAAVGPEGGMLLGPRQDDWIVARR
jgi:Xaa-Pro aminopeptidase